MCFKFGKLSYIYLKPVCAFTSLAGTAMIRTPELLVLSNRSPRLSSLLSIFLSVFRLDHFYWSIFRFIESSVSSILYWVHFENSLFFIVFFCSRIFIWFFFISSIVCGDSLFVKLRMSVFTSWSRLIIDALKPLFNNIYLVLAGLLSVSCLFSCELRFSLFFVCQTI